jgi:hypothetical protein
VSEARPQEIDNKIQEYRKAVDRDPGSPLFVPLAQAYLTINNPAEALEVCRSGLAFLPDLPEGRLVLSKALCRLGRLREAEAELAALVALAPALDEAPDLLAQLRAGQLVTLDIRPIKPIAKADEDQIKTRGISRPVTPPAHPAEEELQLDEVDEDMFPAEKTIGQGAPIPEGLQEPSEEEIDGQATVQGPPLRRSGVFTPPPTTGSMGAIFEDEDGEEDEGESTRPLIEMKQQTEARLSWQERSKLIQEDKGGLADLFSASPGKKSSVKPSILPPELRKSLDSSNVLGSVKELVTTELRKSGEIKVPPLATPKPEPKHPEESDPRKSGELQAMPNFRSSSFKSLGPQKHDSKPSAAASAKPIEIPPAPEPLDPPKRRTQVVPKGNKTPMFSPLEEVKGNKPIIGEAEAMPEMPLPGKQKFPTAPLVPAVKHKPIMELLDAPGHQEPQHPAENAPKKSPSGQMNAAPPRSPSQSNNSLRSVHQPGPAQTPDFFSPLPPPPSGQVIGPAPLGPQEIPILPPEKKPSRPPIGLIGGAVALFLALIIGLFFYSAHTKKQSEVIALLGAVDGLVTEGSAAGLSSAEDLLSKAFALSPNDNAVLSQIALVEGMRLLVLREERVERLGDAIARADENNFSDENIHLGKIALASQSGLKDALQKAKDARIKLPKSALLAFAEGFITGELGKLAESKTLLQESLALSPSFVWSRVALAEQYAFANSPELMPLLEAELQERPGNTRALALALLRYNTAAKLPAEAELREQLKRAFKLDLGKRESEWLRLALARHYYLIGNDQESKLMADSFARVPAQNPMIALLAAELFYANGQHSIARENILSASKVLPEESWVAPLCESLLNNENTAGVEPLLAKLPDGAMSKYLRGRLLLLLKDNTRAIPELTAAASEDPALQGAVFYAMLAVLGKQDTNLDTINTLSNKLAAMNLPAETPRVLPAPYPRSLPILVKSRILRAQNKPDEAQRIISSGLKMSPSDELLLQENNQ